MERRWFPSTLVHPPAHTRGSQVLAANTPTALQAKTESPSHAAPASVRPVTRDKLLHTHAHAHTSGKPSPPSHAALASVRPVTRDKLLHTHTHTHTHACTHPHCPTALLPSRCKNRKTAWRFQKVRVVVLGREGRRLPTERGSTSNTRAGSSPGV